MSRHADIEDQAIGWLIRRDEPGWTEGDEANLAAWLQQSLANRAAFLRAEFGWAAADRIGAVGEAADFATRHPGAPALWRSAAIAASLMVALGIGSSILPLQAPSEQTMRYDTPRGGHKLVRLGDGSRIELNTQSAVRTAIDAKRREIWLDSGEAYFEVARNEGKAFVVHAGGRTITVLGTRFAVRRDGDRVMVNVVEGRVKVEDSNWDNASAAIVTAGDTVIARAGSTLIAPKSAERVERAIAWRGGMLTFNLISLSEVAAEFNRYNQVQLSVDPSAAAIPIGGTFRAANVEAFARLLNDAYGLKAERVRERIIISK